MIIHLLMVKEPVPGRVKTRLAKTLGNEAAARLYAAFAQDVLETGRAAGLMTMVAYDPPGALRAIRSWLPGAGACLPQAGGDLGQRMQAAFADALEAVPDARGVVLTGSDLPDLPADHLRQAAAAVESGHTVLGPTRDGGYCLLGVPAGLRLPDVFSNMPWSTPQVREETLRRLRGAGVEPYQLPAWQDVDDANDLAALRCRLQAAPAAAPLTRRVLQALAEEPEDWGAPPRHAP